MSTLNQCRVQSHSLVSSQIMSIEDAGSGEEPVLIQCLDKIPLLSYFANFYRKVIHTADIRANKFPMLQDPDGPAALVLAYLFICLFIGPKYMRNRKTPKMTLGLLFLYNFLTVQMNGFLALTLTYHVFSNNFSLTCQPLEPEGKDADWVMSLLYMFHISKIVELLDTVFLVWKKKNNQLTFLHFYHHSTIIPATWIGVKFAPGGSTAVIAMINSWVHVFMYIYYQLAAGHVIFARKYKKFMTILQISQFSYTLLVCSMGLWIKPCNYPNWILWWLFLYMISFLMLFGKFFRETYIRGGKKVQLQNNLRNVRIYAQETTEMGSYDQLATTNVFWKSQQSGKNGIRINFNLKQNSSAQTSSTRKRKTPTSDNLSTTFEIKVPGARSQSGSVHTSTCTHKTKNSFSSTCLIL